ncbi:conjugal transfer protein [Planotetraspora thailandica]|nr:conjugal transfer protein [Planotetraspora thailandica]
MTSSQRGGWGGGGGRWLVWTGRAILWALIIVIVVNGVRAPFERFSQGDTKTTTAAEPTDSEFPVTQAAAFANQFAAVYLNYDASNAQQRAERLRPFLPQGADDQFGWNGYGRMTAGSIQFSGIKVNGDHDAVVTVSYQSGGERGLLSVPVYYDQGHFVVSAQPGLLPAPAIAGLPQPADPARDGATEAELRPQIEGFFKAFASGDPVDLQRYVASGVTINGFNGEFTLAKLDQLIVPEGAANSREVTAVVVWAISSNGSDAVSTSGENDPSVQPGGLEQAYTLSMEKQGGKWFVQQVQGASRSVG